MSLIRKLKVAQEQPLYLIDAPPAIHEEFPDFDIRTSLPNHRSVSQLILFALDKNTLDTKAPTILKFMSQDGLLWIAYPKKSGSIRSDLIRDEGWQTMYKSDWQGVASISINDDWSGIRFRSKAATQSLRRLPPIAERKVEGIDFVNRTVTLPPDAVNAMKAHAGLEDFFYSMSFTHKKEYVESIVEAKKPKTRQRRIEKMVAAVTDLRSKKEAKKKK